MSHLPTIAAILATWTALSIPLGILIGKAIQSGSTREIPGLAKSQVSQNPHLAESGLAEINLAIQPKLDA